MKTVLMAIAVIKDDTKILLRKIDPVKNPYDEPYALFGGRIDGEGTIQDLLNVELSERWNFSVAITEKLWWDEETKVDHDDEEKRFVYVDAICTVDGGRPSPTNPNEALEWVELSDLNDYELNPPTHKLLSRLGYVA